MKNRLPYLDVNINYACNLACQGCISLSDFNRKGSVRISEGEAWLKEWSKLLDVDEICLFGGEPLLNADIQDWIELTRLYFPTSHLKVITNGYYLKQSHVAALMTAGNATLQISFHILDDRVIKSKIKHATTGFDWKVSNDNKNEVVFLKFQNDSMTIQCAKFGEFRKPYKGNGINMEPWESSDLRSSISKCGSPKNPVLYGNRIYKCAPIANLKDTLNTLATVTHIDKWHPYLTYTGFGIDDDLSILVNDFGKPNKICSMCCSNRDSEIDHYASGMVRKKKK